MQTFNQINEEYDDFDEEFYLSEAPTDEQRAIWQQEHEEYVNRIVKILDENHCEYEFNGGYAIIFVINKDEFETCATHILQESIILLRSNIIDEILK